MTLKLPKLETSKSFESAECQVSKRFSSYHRNSWGNMRNNLKLEKFVFGRVSWARIINISTVAINGTAHF
jgi:hypothetical protein